MERHFDQELEALKSQLLLMGGHTEAIIQKSVESPGFRGMTLNYQERRIYHWHEELDRRILAAGIDLPAHLRVEPKLEQFYEET